MKENQKKRRPPISYRPPRSRRDAFEERVRASGLSANAFITECIFGRTRHRPAELRSLAKILAACAMIADEVRYLRKRVDPPTSRLLEELVSEMRIIRSALMRLLGRKS